MQSARATQVHPKRAIFRTSARIMPPAFFYLLVLRVCLSQSVIVKNNCVHYIGGFKCWRRDCCKLFGETQALFQDVPHSGDPSFPLQTSAFFAFVFLPPPHPLTLPVCSGTVVGQLGRKLSPTNLLQFFCASLGGGKD